MSDSARLAFSRKAIQWHASRLEVGIPSGIQEKAKLLDLLGSRLAFPPYYGENWDALEECLRDFSWIEPYQIVVVHDDVPLSNDDHLMTTYLNILRATVAFWENRQEHDVAVLFPSSAAKLVTKLD